MLVSERPFFNILPDNLKPALARFGEKFQNDWAIAYHKKRMKALRRTRTYQPNGARECARRMRQMADGRLTVENGLWLANTAG